MNGECGLNRRRKYLVISWSFQFKSSTFFTQSFNTLIHWHLQHVIFFKFIFNIKSANTILGFNTLFMQDIADFMLNGASKATGNPFYWIEIANTCLLMKFFVAETIGLKNTSYCYKNLSQNMRSINTLNSYSN